jgi:hypothetical protein
VTQHDPIDAAAMELIEQFHALTKKYSNRDVAVRAVTGILSTTAYAASNSLGDARKLVESIAAEASKEIDEIHEMEKTRKNEA